MEEIEINKLSDKTNAFFDDYFETLDLNKDMEKLYEIIDDDELYDEFEKNVRLTNLRNENHKRYYNIDTLKYKDLPKDFDDVLEDILVLYSYIDPKKILSDNSFDADNTKILLNNIYRRIDRLNRMATTYLKQITKSNDEKQSNFSAVYFETLSSSVYV